MLSFSLSFLTNLQLISSSFLTFLICSKSEHHSPNISLPVRPSVWLSVCLSVRLSRFVSFCHGSNLDWSGIEPDWSGIEPATLLLTDHHLIRYATDLTNQNKHFSFRRFTVLGRRSFIYLHNTFSVYVVFSCTHCCIVGRHFFITLINLFE